MELDISSQERRAVHYVGLNVSARLTEFGATGGPNAQIPRIYGWLNEHGIAPAGGPLYIYRRIDGPEDPVDLTVAVPVAEPVEPTEGLTQSSLPAGTYVVGRHVGSPDGIPASCEEVGAWAEAKGHKLGATGEEPGKPWTGFVESYLTDPAEEPDPSKWVTELLFATL